MRKHKPFVLRFSSFFATFLSALSLIGCGSDDAKQGGTPTPTAKVDKSSHTVSVSEHQAFEQKYTEQCIRSQQTDASSAFTNDQELGKVCQCMAREISKRISKADVVHYLEKHEFPFDMVMMTNQAVAVCDTAKN